MVSRQSGGALPRARRRIIALSALFGIGIALAAPGDLDPGFGQNGLVSLTVGFFTSDANSVVQQTDGKLALAGVTRDAVNNADFVVVRLAADGTPDATFGVDGIATANFGIDQTIDSANAVIQQSDGKLVLVGGEMFDSTTERSDVALARFNADGSLDATFGDSGLVTLDIDFVENAQDVLQQANGKLVITGATKSTTNCPCTERAFFARFNTNGSLDTSFGTGGTTLVTLDGGLESSAIGFAQQPDGKLVAVGRARGAAGNSDMLLLRVTADGMLDPLFDGDGSLVVDFDERYEVGYGVAIQPDGAIVAAGFTVDPEYPSADYASAMLRVTADGDLDGTFGEAGKSVVDLGRPSYLDSIVVLPDNSYAVAGTRINSAFGADMIVAHFNANGTLDPAYGVEGVATADFGIGNIAPFSKGAELIQQADGKLVAVAQTYFDSAISVARFDDGATHPGVIGLTTTSQTVTEDTATVVYTVRRTGGKTGPISVDYATVAGSAQPGTDFVSAASVTLDWNDGDASDQSITIDLIDDELAETPENFTLVLLTPTGGAGLAASEATINIQDMDGPGELSLTWPEIDVGDGNVDEGVGTTTMSVLRGPGSQGEISVQYRFNNGSATAGSDFINSSGTLTWADGDSNSKSIEVGIIDDALDEETEQFDVELFNATGGATLSPSRQIVTVPIVDNDPPGSGGGGGGGGAAGWLSLLLLAGLGFGKQNGAPANGKKEFVEFLDS